jgi:hypothetical protein
MADESITRVSVSGFSLSIIGIQELMADMAKTHADKSDEEIRSYMLEELAKANYIPPKAMNEYRRAFVRELRKFLGQPYAEDGPNGLDVKVLGMGCTQCHTLTRVIMEVLTELKLPASVDHVMDIKEIARYGIMGSPALLINGKAVAVESVPPRDRIKKWLTEASASAGGN